MKNGLVKDNSKKIFEALRELGKKRVLVGIPASESKRYDDSPINNSTIGYIMEKGSPARNIPARPFLIPAIEKSLPMITEIFKQGARTTLSGLQTSDYTLGRVGLFAQAQVKKYIVAGGSDWPPLADTTLRARARAGAKGTKPLIRTGSLLNSINYVIREK